MLLSILIPTIVGREQQFEYLVERLNKQIGLLGNIEIVSCKDNKEISIGAKRQQLIEAAQGKYSVQCDDDDWLADNFIERVYPFLHADPDAVTYLESVNGTQVACHSSMWQSWANNKEGYQYVRTPFYKDVIRTDIVKQIGFKDMRYGEDADFAERLKKSGLIKSEVFLNEIMYYYHMKPLTKQEHAERYGIK